MSTHSTDCAHIHRTQQPKGRGRMDGLTGLRALAALWVVSFHYGLGPFGPLHLQHTLPAIKFGYLGVDLFFMLSGFVIWHAHAEDFHRPTLTKFKRFMMLRIARLFPVYLFTLLLVGAVFLLGTVIPDWSLHNPTMYRPQEFLASLTMMQTWGLAAHLSWNYPDWSVSAEWFCYFLFPFAVLLLIGLGGLRAGLAVIALLLALAGIYVFAFGQTMNHAIGWAALARALVEFLIGCLLRQISDHVNVNKINWTLPFLLLLGATLLAFATHSVLAHFMPILLFPALILAASTRANAIGRLAASGPLVVVGSASYSLYLMQAPIEKAAKPLRQLITPDNPGVSAVIALLYIAALAAGTFCVYRFIEQPMRRLLRQRLARQIDHGTLNEPRSRVSSA